MKKVFLILLSGVLFVRTVYADEYTDENTEPSTEEQPILDDENTNENEEFSDPPNQEADEESENPIQEEPVEEFEAPEQFEPEQPESEQPESEQPEPEESVIEDPIEEEPYEEPVSEEPIEEAKPTKELEDQQVTKIKQGNYSIEGTVYFEEKPISAKLSIEGHENIETDENGHYKFNKLQAGQYQIIVTEVDGESVNKAYNVKVEHKNKLRQDIHFNEEEVYETVKSSKSSTKTNTKPDFTPNVLGWVIGSLIVIAGGGFLIYRLIKKV